MDGDNNPVADDELVEAKLFFDAGKANLDGYKLTLWGSNKVAFWTTPEKGGPGATEFVIGTDTVPARVYIEGLQTGATTIVWGLRKPDGLTPVVEPDEAIVTVVDANLTAYRPQTPHFLTVAVPESQEEDVKLGPGIRRNGDDDDGDLASDWYDTPVPGEDDLIRLDVWRDAGLSSDVDFVLTRSDASRLQVWKSSDKSGGKVFDADATPLEEVPPRNRLWVEWVRPGTGEDRASLELEVRDPRNGNKAFSDKVVFHAFTSVIVVLGGEGQDPADPVLEPNNHGIFRFAISEYRKGYDVYMYNEDVVNSYGEGAAYTEVKQAIQRRGVSRVGIIGYSHGGGSTHDLAARLMAHQTEIGQFAIVFTSYIDAIRNDSDVKTAPETRRPPGSLYHVSQWQTTGVIDGAPSNADDDLNRDSLGVTHYTIDDNQLVLEFLTMRFEQKVTR